MLCRHAQAGRAGAPLGLGVTFVVAVFSGRFLARCVAQSEVPLPRALTIDGTGQQFVDAEGRPVLMVGTNIVVKGPPFIPDASGSVACGEPPNCDDMHSCNTTCTTFNKADAALLRQQGYNFIRLGVPWAGGQPTKADELDPQFKHSLQSILKVCEEAGIYAVLDLHQDAVATANCVSR
eukprot:SAG31_NODE_16_length_36206_cov_27.355728_12_plen_179_part_00